MSMRTKNQRGFALPAAIGSLVIVGFLVTAGFYVARQELRVGVASKNSLMAMNLAQMGANEVLASWNGYNLGNLALWDDTTVTGTASQGNWSVTIRNLNNIIYYLDATGRVTAGGLWAGAERRVGVVTKMIFADIDPPAALTARGATEIAGSAVVMGSDSIPEGWNSWCDSTDVTEKPGIAIDEDSLLTITGNNVQVDSIVEDPTIVAETFTNFGNMTWEELTALASAEGMTIGSEGNTTNLSGTVYERITNGRCDTGYLNNWGNPGDTTSACFSYFPLIYSPGSLQIQGDYGQGILLVEEDLQIRGNFTFNGLIIVQGTLTLMGTGNERPKISGGVMAGNAEFNPDEVNSTETTASGNSYIQNSTCSLQRAILNNASLSRARPIATRSWVDLTNANN